MAGSGLCWRRGCICSLASLKAWKRHSGHVCTVAPSRRPLSQGAARLEAVPSEASLTAAALHRAEQHGLNAAIKVMDHLNASFELHSVMGHNDSTALTASSDFAAMVQERAVQSAHLDIDAPWVEKYRPKTLDDVAAHTDIIDTSADHTPPPLPHQPAAVKLLPRGRRARCTVYDDAARQSSDWCRRISCRTCCCTDRRAPARHPRSSRWRARSMGRLSAT